MMAVSMPPLLPAVPDQAAYLPLWKDVPTWLPAAAVVAARHGLPAPGLGDWLHGSDLVFAAGRDAVLKITCPLFLQQHHAERRMLERLSEAPGVGAPRILASGEIEGWPYLVLSRVGGVRLRDAWAEVGPAERVAIAEDIGHRLALIHALPSAGLEDIYDPWPAFLAQRREEAVERHRRMGTPEAVLAELPSAIDAAGPLPRPGAREVPIHADLTHENVHIERVEGRWRVAGVLDFGDAMLGDPEYDLMTPGVFIAAGDGEVRAALFRGAGQGASLGDAALPARMAAWMILHRFGTLTDRFGKAPDPPKATLREGMAGLWGAASPDG